MSKLLCIIAFYQGSTWLEPSAESLLESPNAELSLNCKLLSISIPQDQGKTSGSKTRNPGINIKVTIWQRSKPSMLISQITRVTIFWRLITSSISDDGGRHSLLNMEYQLRFYVTDNLRSFTRNHCFVFFSVNSLIKVALNFTALSEALNGKSIFVSWPGAA